MRIPHPAGSTCPNNFGYVREKPTDNPYDWKLQHRLVVERVIGKPLPPKSVVHHVNGIVTDNRPCNLVLCENQAYHKLLDTRTKAYKACGNANYRRCYICDEWDDPAAMQRNGTDYCFIHRECRRVYRAQKAAIWRESGRIGPRP